MSASAPEPALPARSYWQTGDLGRAVAEVIIRSELPTIGHAPKGSFEPTPGNADLSRWLRHAGRKLGVEGLPEQADARTLRNALARSGPYVVAVTSRDGDERALTLIRSGRRDCSVICPDGSQRHLNVDELCEALAFASADESLLTRLFEDLPAGRRVLQRMIERGEFTSQPFTVVRYAPSGAQPFWAQLRELGVRQRLVAYVATTAAQGLVAALAAFTLGASALTGVIDASRVIAWSLLAASNVPLQYIASYVLGHASIDAAATFKKRLLEGTLRISESELRASGFGSMIARLNEASVVEQANVTQLFGVLAPTGQLLAAAVLLAVGVLPMVELSLLALFFAFAIGLAVAHHRRYRDCYRARLALSEDLVEKIVGHRTRAVQANPSTLHDEEDAALHGYGKVVTSLDRLTTLTEVYGRLWLLSGGAALLFVFALGASGPALLPSAIGVFLGYTSLPALLAAARSFTAWWCAWQGVRPLFDAGLEDTSSPPKPDTSDAGRSTIVSSVSFTYRAREVFRNTNLRIESGERILIGGPSGGGKTTFSKLLTGELRATSGTILVNGVDCASVSQDAWRRRVVSSPQFHENYVFSNTFGFNVDPRGLEGELSPEARQVCFELGLKELLGKMPSRAAQLLGETGWQLSHGERSRVFIARSLLQGADLLIFDESFAALDPETLALALECVRKRAQTLLVIAHQ